ncbi:ATP-binding cassette domain-containing protein [Marinicella sp. S1101]|uniref:ABC-F family ATP-binding cassette domain-containing protein n=1 Tax=Marinicella marina TaxID=2996016 RepID=UPI0022608E88|nr:ATP-binding cassette domain-containing protein [Marinicella marina]MCX7554277.1 ATP-binding cassette domain-containing protein [Marinicella marina]MDJ1138732.1 ATP-binding cassette domain-containing protein [Marinicella marina]
MIQLTNLSLRRGHKLLFEEASVSIHPGQKVGLTGANGTGKSSLFALLMGSLQADLGECSVPKGWRIAHVKQETPALAVSAMDYVLDGDVVYRDIEQKIAKATAADEHEKLGELYAEMEHIDGYAAHARAGRLLNGLGFSSDETSQPVKSFSGGWRMRLNLAQALMCPSDLLLLDEPTNHLDLEAVVWLQDWLKRYEGTLWLISHDRDFLDGVVGHILHIEHEQLTLYSGNYSDFEKARMEQMALQQAMFEKQQKQIAHMQAYVDRFRYKASKAKQAQSRLKALERMDTIAAAQAENPFHFEFYPCQNLRHQIVELEHADIGYGEHKVFKDLSFSVTAGARIGLLGRNGAGKSTLIKAMSGDKALQKGELKTAKDLHIGYFAQHQLEQLDPSATAIEHVLQLDPKATEQDIKNFLGGFGFRGDKADTPVKPFSGGEKARLALALIVYQRPDLLLLDEPTNHLDLNMRDAISFALQSYEGAVILVSHDKHMLNSVIDEMVYIDRGQIHPFDGDLDEYQSFIKAQIKAAEAEEAAANNVVPINKKQNHKANKAAKNRFQKLDKLIEQHSQKLTDLTAKLGEAEIYEPENQHELQQCMALSQKLKSELEEYEAEWLELSEELEG